MDVLSDLVGKCKQEGEVIIMGDTNCNFGKQIAPRFNGVTTRNANVLLDMIKMYNLEIFFGYDICNGPRYTFEVEGVGSSYIDHCFRSAVMWDRLVKCDVIGDDIQNTSDHLPTAISIRDDDIIPQERKEENKAFVPWEK